MLIERAEILVKEGSEDAFVTAMNERGLPILTSVEGVKSVRMGRGVENPDKFMLLVEWESMDAHRAFPNLPVFPSFRELIGSFSKGGGMEHFEMS